MLLHSRKLFMSNFANPSVGKLVVSNSSDDFFFFGEPFSQMLARPDSLSSVDLPLKWRVGSSTR